MAENSAVISCSPSEKRKEKEKKKKRKRKRKEKEGEKRRKEKKGQVRSGILLAAQRRAARLGGHVHPAVRGTRNFRPFLLFRDPPGPVSRWRAVPGTGQVGILLGQSLGP